MNNKKPKLVCVGETFLTKPADHHRSWFKEYFDKFQFIIPRKRYSFYKKGSKTNSSWFDTCWFCYKMNLPRDILKL